MFFFSSVAYKVSAFGKYVSTRLAMNIREQYACFFIIFQLVKVHAAARTGPPCVNYWSLLTISM